jgi:hypothetical protein
MGITLFSAAVGEQLISVIHSWQEVVVTIVEIDRIGIEAPEGVDVKIEGLTQAKES